jgi:hypothetical protein
VADSDAVRSRRKRRHAAGDHSECRRCSGRVLSVVPIVPAAAEVDVRAEMNALARRLEAAHMADPLNVSVARELRLTLQALAGVEPPADDPLAELRAMVTGDQEPR